MADIDNIPLHDDFPLLQTYDAGLLWNPEEGASNSEWHTFLRTHIDLADDHYETQFDALMDELMHSRRQTVLLQAFVSRLFSAALAHGEKNGTVKHVEGGIEMSDPFLVDLDRFAVEYQKISGSARIEETEGFREWNASETAKEVNPDDPENVPDPI